MLSRLARGTLSMHRTRSPEKETQLTRSLSISSDNGVIEDIGERLPFEEPFWSGRHRVGDGYPLPFHPLELGEAALKEFFGYQLEGDLDSELLKPESIPLIKYKRKRLWWKFS